MKNHVIATTLFIALIFAIGCKESDLTTRESLSGDYDITINYDSSTFSYLYMGATINVTDNATKQTIFSSYLGTNKATISLLGTDSISYNDSIRIINGKDSADYVNFDNTILAAQTINEGAFTYTMNSSLLKCKGKRTGSTLTLTYNLSGTGSVYNSGPNLTFPVTFTGKIISVNKKK